MGEQVMRSACKKCSGLHFRNYYQISQGPANKLVYEQDMKCLLWSMIDTSKSDCGIEGCLFILIFNWKQMALKYHTCGGIVIDVDFKMKNTKGFLSKGATIVIFANVGWSLVTAMFYTI